MIQNFAPSCLNRDDTNSPKDCEFGGYRRARISSQCLKRAIRWDPLFAGTVKSGVGVRTKRLVERVSDALVKAAKDAEAARAVAAAVVGATMGTMKGDLTAVLVYLGEDEIDRIRDLILDGWDALEQASAAVSAAEGSEADKPGKKGKDKPSPLADAAKAVADKFKSATRAADIALFGRMVAENTDMNVDAACQVAHAISTHKVSMEMDFYTAVDDLNPEDATGAGMMGTIEFNSSCFYRYSVVNVDQLSRNLGDDRELAATTVEAFLRASVAAIPAAKQNSMAAQNPPSLVFAVVRDGGGPWSLANAFETPVRPRETGGLVRQSIEALADYWGQLAGMYGEEAVKTRALCCLGDAELGPLTDYRRASVAEVVSAVHSVIAGGE